MSFSTTVFSDKPNTIALSYPCGPVFVWEVTSLQGVTHDRVHDLLWKGSILPIFNAPEIVSRIPKGL